MRLRSLGNTGIKVGAIGLGCMGMSWLYQESSRDDERSVRVINEALDLGGNLLDTADLYGAGHNETLLGKAIAGRREEAVVATKSGIVLEDLSLRAIHRDGSPAHLRKAAEASLRRLNIDVIDLYYLHRIDPAVPLAETWGTMAELVQRGLVRWLGLSEATVAQAREAHAIHPVTAVQSELSLWTRDPLDGGPEGVVGWCESVGASFVPFAPLGRGFLTGTLRAGQFESSDFRTANPRFCRAAMEANQHIVDVIREVADRRSITPAQVAIAWTLAQGEHVVPIPGTKNSRYLRENLAAVEVRLADEDFADLLALPAPVGSRY
ncbi:aldo/keto reductase [Streptomyces sp. HNM0645]|uniref:aldo/keto reductase n=1 Tax=Streptomyces sp. HNM0645 TaxID=2782343 RepID=UPI0024B6DEE4|nr:aldo/keto reductase [Streptomyces sp. HNM0645]MDI9886794.1 aldo/keto reductase [Streptomyces sp. HNM0645]